MPIPVNKTDQEKLILEILAHLAQKNNKPPERIKLLLLRKQNRAIAKQFWEMLDNMFPNHPYQYMGCCPDCGFLELHETLPFEFSYEC